MDPLTKLPREARLLLGGGLLYLICSFLDWQQVSTPFGSAGVTEWHGVGVIAGLLAVALLVWEAGRVLGYEIPSIPSGLLSLGIALGLLLFTLITFVSHDFARHWPAWIGLLLSIGIAAVAVPRARAEGVAIPELGALARRMERPADGAPTGADAEPPAEGGARE